MGNRIRVVSPLVIDKRKEEVHGYCVRIIQWTLYFKKLTAIINIQKIMENIL